MTVIDRRYGVAEGLAVKAPCRLATTANITLSGLQSIDGVTTVADDRVLVKNQTTASENGIYLASTGNWTRDLDFDGSLDVVKGTQVYVNEGTANAASKYVVTSTDPVTIGTSSIVFSALSVTTAELAAIAPFYSVNSPSSGVQLQGSGVPTRHQLVWSDANAEFWADTIGLNSTDPSAIATITVTGTPATGTLSLQFQYGAHTVNLSIAVTTGQTTTQVAAAIVTAIKANTTLFSLVSSTRIGGGGYDLGGQIGGISSNANVVAYDYDVRNSTQIAYTAGTTNLTLTFGVGQNATSTNYALPTAWDNDPVIALSRLVTGIAPPANSVIGAIQFAGSQSVSPSSLTVQYGSISVAVINSTTGALSSRIQLVTPDVNNVQNQGLFIGAGAYTVGVADKGVDTFNANAYWLAGAYTISKSGSTLRIDTLATGDPVVIAAKTGMGMTPTGELDVNGYATSFGTLNAPTTGSGFSIFGGAGPGTIAFNWGSSTYLASVHLALSWDFKPSNSSTSGVTISANLLQPDADNATALGASNHRWSAGFFGTLSATTTLTISNTAVTSGLNVVDVSKDWSAPGSSNVMASYTSYGDVGRFVMRNAGGTAAAATATVAGSFGNVGWRGYYTSGGPSFTASSPVLLYASAIGTFTSADWGSTLTIQTTPAGSTAGATSATFQGSGGVTIGATATDPGIGSLFVNTKAGIGTNAIASAILALAAGTTAKSQINLPPSTAPTSPNDGDFWYDGTNVKIRVGGTTKTFTIS